MTSFAHPAQAQGVAGDPKFFDFAEVSNGNTTPQTLIDITVPANTKRNLHQLWVICRQSGTFQITIDGSKVGSGSTAPGSPLAFMSWVPTRPALTGKQIIVTFTQLAGTPSSNLFAYLQTTDLPS